MRLDKDMKPLAEELKRELVLDVPDGLPLLNTDSELFVVGLEKLIENAIRYTKDDGVITIAGKKDESNLVVSIADNGIGMSDEDKAQLGTIYFRSDDDHVREFKGSGLGIPIAYGLFDLLGATYSVETELGKGTTFTVSIKGMT
jgi:signal transduction histidine kinase